MKVSIRTFLAENSTFYKDFLALSNWASLMESETSKQEFSRCGFYRDHIHLGESQSLTLLVLNTNLYYKTNNTGPDPCDQLAWLRRELASMTGGEKNCIVTAHVPPGFFERDVVGDEPYMTNAVGDHHYNEQLAQILGDEHGDKIIAQIYGHTHTDTFRLFQNQVTRAQRQSSPQ